MAKNWNDQQAREAEERRRKMAALKREGWTYAAIGRRFGGITRQRVRAIILKLA